MKKIIPNLLLVALSVSVLLIFASASQAKCGQGCCSSHKGVCSYQCCDKTPLSDICAPCYSSAIDRQIKVEINEVKKDYKEHHEGRREELIRNIKSGFGENIDIDRIGFFVYTMMPDVK